MKIRWSLVFATSFVVSMLSLRAQGRDYFVDASAADGGTGETVEAPARDLSALVGKLAGGDTVFLAEGTYDQPVVLTDSGTAEQPIVIRNADGQTPVISATHWQLNGVSHVVLEGLTFKDCPHPALWIGPTAPDNVIRKCNFINCPPPDSGPYEKAIWVKGTGNHRVRIEDNVFERPYDPIVGHSYPERPEAVNNAEGNQYWIFRGNKFSGYMYGIQLGVGAQGDPPAYTLIENNEFFDCNEGVHVKTADNIVRGNYIHDMRWGNMGPGHGIYVRAGQRTVVENNRIERAGWAGVRVNGDHHLIRNNVITETLVGVWLPQHSYGGAGRSIWIVHNTVVGAMLPIWIEGSAKAHVFNNILAADQDRPTGIFVAGWGMTNPMKTYNTAWYQHMAGVQKPSGRLAADYNLFVNCPPPSYEYLHSQDPKWHRHHRLYGGHNMQGDPGFVDAANGDFRLRPDSAARAAGRNLPNCPRDIADRPRPTQSPDLGAYQSTDEADQ